MNFPLSRLATAKYLAQTAGLLGAWVLGASVSLTAQAQSDELRGTVLDSARRVELINLVRQDCGSCHGLTLKGGLGPTLLPEALRDKPADSLKATILYGRPGTAMPPWSRFVSDMEAEWIVANLQRGFPRAQ